MTKKNAVQESWLNSKNMARSLEISPSTFCEYPIEPAAELNGQKFYTVRSVVDFYVDRLQEKMLAGQDDCDLIAQQTRLTRLRGDKLALENELARNEVAPIEILSKVISAGCKEACAILGSLKGTIRRAHPEISHTLLDTLMVHVVRAQNSIAKMKLPEDIFDE